MAFGKFLVKMLAYSDDATSNDPQKVDFDYYKEFSETLVTSEQIGKVCPTGNTTICITSPSKWLFLLTDQTTIVKINGAVGTELTVTPSAAGTQDGVLLLRVGSMTSLVLNVPGLTSANVKVFASS